MIAAFLEGLAQAGLPCSWVILVPAFVVGLSTKKSAPIAAFVGATVVFAWMAVSGWISPPVWLAGLSLLVASASWWQWGMSPLPAGLIGVAAAWAWQPCVGEQLGKALNLAQHDPLGALPGLAAFMIGVMLVGLGIGEAVRWWLSRRRSTAPRWIGPGVVGLLGVLMVSGVYGPAASAMARWSTEIWG